MKRIRIVIGVAAGSTLITSLGAVAAFAANGLR